MSKVQDFIKYAANSETDECIMWPYAANNAGYGHFGRGGKTYSAHRAVCAIAHGDPPDDGREYYAAHAPKVCHSPSCVNPRHLSWRTPAENQADRRQDRTDNRGERHHLSKLNKDDIAAIRTDSRKQTVIAAEYGVTQTQVSRIKLRKNWGHVC